MTSKIRTNEIIDKFFGVRGCSMAQIRIEDAENIKINDFLRKSS
jgi:hypothetical protein